MTINVCGLTDEWFILLTVNCFRGVIAVFHIAVVGYIVDQYCLRFDRGVVHIVWLAILLTITISGLRVEWFILFWLAILVTITV